MYIKYIDTNICMYICMYNCMYVFYILFLFGIPILLNITCIHLFTNRHSVIFGSNSSRHVNIKV